jgi:hypothetical protein
VYQRAGAVLATVALAAALIAVIGNGWRVDPCGSAVIGLWRACQTSPAGGCRAYAEVFGSVPYWLRAVRGLMIIGVVLAATAWVASLLLLCRPASRESSTGHRLVRIIAFATAAGMLSMLAAAGVYSGEADDEKQYSMFMSANKARFGWAFALAWVSVGMLALAGFVNRLLSSLSFPDDDDSDFA